MNEIDPTLKTEKRTAVPKPYSKGNKSPAASPESAQKKDRVTLSKTTQVPASKSSGGSEIRYDLINKYKAALRKGGYKVKADEIAEKMVQKIRDNKGPTIY